MSKMQRFWRMRGDLATMQSRIAYLELPLWKRWLTSEGKRP